MKRKMYDEIIKECKGHKSCGECKYSIKDPNSTEIDCIFESMPEKWEERYDRPPKEVK